MNENIDNILELLGAIYIQTARNYDMLAIIADKIGADAKGLTKLHKEGQILAPAPAMIVEEDIERENND